MAIAKLPKPWKVSLMELFFVGLAALIVGFLLGMKYTAKAALPGIKDIQGTQAIDRANYLFILRRELANILIWRDPQRYLRLYQELSSELSSLESWRLEEIKKRLAELCEKYPSYNDFDIIASKEYVLYPDAVSWNSYEQLEAHYRDIATFVALSLIGDASWNNESWRIKLDFTHKFVPDGNEHLSEYIEQIEDTKLIMRIGQAMDAYYTMRDKETEILDNDFFTVKMLYRSSPDICYGLHIKRTNEFAIFSRFIHDDGDITDTHYRSDSAFEKEQLLHPNFDVLSELKRPL
jgi:hypothetical protein